MKNYEYFDYHFEHGNTVAAAAVAVKIAEGKSARSARSAWLGEAVKLMPTWEAAAREADRYDKWEQIEALVQAALKAVGLDMSSIYQI